MIRRINFPIFTRRLCAINLLALLQACSSCPTFQAAWYVTESGEESNIKTTTYLALMHDDDKEVQISELVLNGTAEGKGGRSIKQAITLAPGRLYILQGSDFAPDAPQSGCVIPARLDVVCAADRRSKHIKLNQMPSALSDQWLKADSGDVGGGCMLKMPSK